MKRFVLSVFTVFIAAGTMLGQSPEAFNYQAIVRDASGNAVVNQNVSVKISLLKGSATGLSVYSEIHQPTSNSFGLINLQVGNGTINSGSFAPIEWGNNKYFMKIEIDITGGSNYVLMGVSQLLSVPYALYAKSSGNQSGKDTSSTNELQFLSISSDTLYLSQGNFVIIPTSTTGNVLPSGACIMTQNINPPSGFTYTGVFYGGENSWSVKANLPTPRKWAASASVNNKIYAIGGRNSSGYLAINEMYDPITNTWSTKASMSYARTGAKGISVSGKIYIIGGYNNGNVSYNEEYDPITNSWTTKTPIPTARNVYGIVNLDNKIHIIGGEQGTSTLSKSDVHERYNPSTNSWTTLASLPVAREGVSAAVVSGKIYVFGGLTTISSTNYTDEYDPVQDAWNSKTSMPTSRHGMGVQAVNGKIYVIGGLSHTTVVKKNEFYDPISNSWTILEDLPIERAMFGCALLNNKIYVIGGSQGTTYYSTVYEFNPSIFYIHSKN
ncbi:Kelch repeat-containing protein [Bacteroidota bacterium]